MIEELRSLLDVTTQFEALLGLSGGVVAVLSMGVTVSTLVFGAFEVIRKLSASREARFREALNSDDILVLGSYLRGTIGSFTIYEYCRSRRVAARVDQMLERTREFLGSESEIDAEGPTASGRRVESPGDLPSAFEPIREELQTGETWNALARLRRQIEIELRNRGMLLGFKEHHLRSAGQILRLLADRQHIPSDLAQALKFSIRVANHAIHGRDVDEGSALDAVYTAAWALQQLREQPTQRIVT